MLVFVLYFSINLFFRLLALELKPAAIAAVYVVSIHIKSLQLEVLFAIGGLVAASDARIEFSLDCSFYVNTWQAYSICFID